MATGLNQYCALIHYIQPEERSKSHQHTLVIANLQVEAGQSQEHGLTGSLVRAHKALCKKMTEKRKDLEHTEQEHKRMATFIAVQSFSEKCKHFD